MSTNQNPEQRTYGLFDVFASSAFGIVVGLVFGQMVDASKPPIREESYCIEDARRPSPPGMRGDKEVVVKLRSCSKEELERESKIRHMDDKP